MRRARFRPSSSRRSASGRCRHADVRVRSFRAQTVLAQKARCGTRAERPNPRRGLPRPWGAGAAVLPVHGSFWGAPAGAPFLWGLDTGGRRRRVLGRRRCGTLGRRRCRVAQMGSRCPGTCRMHDRWVGNGPQLPLIGCFVRSRGAGRVLVRTLPLIWGSGRAYFVRGARTVPSEGLMQAHSNPVWRTLISLGCTHVACSALKSRTVRIASQVMARAASSSAASAAVAATLP